MSGQINSTIDIPHLAKLSSLACTADEGAKFASQMQETVEYVTNLQELDVDGVPRTASVTGLTSITREDVLDPTRHLPKGDYHVKRIM